MSNGSTPPPIGIYAPEGFNLRGLPATEKWTPKPADGTPSPLGPLVDFVGSWVGFGFNTIFRPSNPVTTGTDNVLELNLTTETLAFSPVLDQIPNRGELQGDIFLSGVPYLQSINDVTTPGESSGIHFEPGIWLSVPATTDPAVPNDTVVRMASIPHGTTILAQGTSFSVPGPPIISPVDITPFTSTGQKITFPSQTASDETTPRIPQVLPVDGLPLTLEQWQAILTDPNSVIRDIAAAQTITKTVVISISTIPAAPLVGGGTQDIAFLVGNPSTNPNANAVSMSAIFWIETVSYNLTLPALAAGTTTVIAPTTTVSGFPMPLFSVTANEDIAESTTVTVSYPQIQYTQTVNLVFKNLNWPHVSVATLVPVTPIPVTV